MEPADRRFVLARRRDLDVEAMSLAAPALIGLHDFARVLPAPGGRHARSATCSTLTVGRHGDEVRIDVVADAFCHSMVRALVGSLLAVGELPDARRRARRSCWPPGSGLRRIAVVPPHGLTLVRVDYPAEHELARRAAAPEPSGSSNTGDRCP